MLRLDDFWVWDSWVADDGERFHLFFLQAPRSLLDAQLRHTSASVGHAVSTDLVGWTYLGVVLRPSRPRSFDDLAIWTGSTVRGDDGVWRMFYSALSKDGHGMHDQRIGVAESADLQSWRRVGTQPIVAVDPRWYKTLPGNPDRSETWRDPFVFKDPDGHGWHMIITARAVGAERLDDGVLGHAWSADLQSWEVLPPFSAPGAGFGQTEVAQVRLVEGTPVLTFTCHPDEIANHRKDELGSYCTWTVRGESLTGPWDLQRAVPMTAQANLFAAPLVRDRSGGWCYLGFGEALPPLTASLQIVDPIPYPIS